MFSLPTYWGQMQQEEVTGTALEDIKHDRNLRLHHLYQVQLHVNHVSVQMNIIPFKFNKAFIGLITEKGEL